MVCKLEEMDFKNLSNTDLFEYIYSLDNVQGKRFKRLEGDALETSRVGIIRHLMSCLNMNVRPDPLAMKEIMEDASKGRAVFDMNKAQIRINSFRPEPEIIEESEDNTVMGLRKGSTTPRKTSVSDGLSPSNQLCIVIDKQFEDDFRQLIGGNRFIRVCAVGRVSSGVMGSAFKNFWSVAKLSDYPRDLKRQLAPKTGTVKFEHFADSLSLAKALSEQADITLPESVIKRLTPPPPPVQEDKKETTPMLHADARLKDLPKWIWKRVEPHQEWSAVINDLIADSRLHPDYKYFTPEEITDAAFKALMGTDKVPSGALKALVFHYLKKNSIHPEPVTHSLVQQVKEMLEDHRVHNPQEGIIRNALRDYVVSTPAAAVAETAQPVVAATTQYEAATPVAAPKVESTETPTNLKDFIRATLAYDGSFTEECPTREDLIAKAKAASIDFKHSSFLATLSLVRRTQKNLAAMGEQPAAPSLPSPKPQSEVKAAAVAQGDAGETPRTAVNPGGPLTIRKLILANLAPDGSLPPGCKTMKDFHVFLTTVMPLPSYKSVENTVYVLRKEIKAGNIEVPKAPIDQPVVPESLSADGERSEVSSEASDAVSQVVGESSAVVQEPSLPTPQTPQDDEDLENGAGEDQLGDERPEPPSPQLDSQAQQPAPIVEEGKEAQSDDELVPESDELKAMRAKVHRARVLFEALDGNPELLRLFFEFRDILPELNTLGEFFDRTPAE